MEKYELFETDQPDRRFTTPARRRQRGGFTVAQRGGPIDPGGVPAFFAQHAEQGVIVQPMALGGDEIGVVFLQVGGGVPLKAALRMGEQFIPGLRRCRGVQPTGLNHILDADERGIAGVQREALIRRTVVVRRPHRQGLPYAVARRREKIHEAIGLGAQGAATRRTGQRRDVQQYPGPPLQQWIIHGIGQLV